MRGASTGEAADILEFQLAMLDDASLSEPAFAAIAAGARADTPGPMRLAGEIAGYEAADDDYFRARSADLKDIREQVLRRADRRQRGSAARRAPFCSATTSRRRASWRRTGRPAAASRYCDGSRRAMSPCWRARAACRWWSGWAAPRRISTASRLLDAEHGRIVLGPTQATCSDFASPSTALWRAPPTCGEGCRSSRPRPRTAYRSRVHVNIADPADVDRIDIASCDGVGLMRTEFLFGRSCRTRRRSTAPIARCSNGLAASR